MLLKAQLNDSLALYRYIENFGNSSESHDFEEQCRINFYSCNDYILRLEVSSLNLSERERTETQNEEEDDFFSNRSTQHKQSSLEVRSNNNIDVNSLD